MSTIEAVLGLLFLWTVAFAPILIIFGVIIIDKIVGWE